MLNFIMWLEARRRKDAPGQQDLFSQPEPETPETPPAPEPEPEIPTSQDQGLAVRLVPLYKLAEMSRKDRTRVFTLRALGRRVDVQDVHLLGNPSRFVGSSLTHNGRRVLLGRDPFAKVIWYPEAAARYVPG